MKTDFKKTLDCYKASHNAFRVVDVPPMQYLMIDGQGTPGVAQEYAAALAALYPLAYALKFASKRDLDRDYVVMPLEGLWWADDMESFTTRRDKSAWHWTLMIMTPDWITRESFEAAKAKVAGGDRPASLDKVRLESLREGTSVQTLHIGSYDDETDTLKRMHNEFIPEAGLRMTGKHHEIYLSDPRKVEPSKLRTILRQPVANV
ncbi:MAG: GyrI-like domain-containing protein [Rhodoglobus sp.]